MSEAIKSKIFSKETGVTISFGFLILLIVSTWRLATTINNYETSMRNLSSDVTALKLQVSQRWSYPMTREAWFELKRLNPTLVVPDVSKIKEEHNLFR